MRENHLPNDVPVALLNAFNTNNRINQYLIDNIPAAAWRAKPPDGKGPNHRRHRRPHAQRARHVAEGRGQGQRDSGATGSRHGDSGAGDARHGAEPPRPERGHQPRPGDRWPRQGLPPRRGRISSAICSRTTPTTAVRSRCWPVRLAIPCRRKSCSACGSGGRDGSSVMPARGVADRRKMGRRCRRLHEVAGAALAGLRYNPASRELVCRTSISHAQGCSALQPRFRRPSHGRQGGTRIGAGRCFAKRS